MNESFFGDEKIYYRTNEHRPQKPNVVFIHGLSGSSSAWAEYEKKIVDTCNVLSVDLRGHGKSFRPREYEEYTVAAYADDIYALLDYLQIENPILVSHSYGTMVALDFLVRYQTRTKAALFLSPAFKVEKGRLARLVHAFFNLISKSNLLPPRTAAGKHIDYSFYKNTGDWNIRRMIADIKNTGLRPYVYTTLQSFHFDRLAALSNITTPVLIMHGKKDTVFPVENAIIMAGKIKNSQLVLLEDADHILVLNNIEEVQKAIDDFVRENWRQKENQ